MDEYYFTLAPSLPTSGFFVTSEGAIECLTCKEENTHGVYWCDHIQDNVLNHRDYQAIWRNGLEPVEFDLEIPMFPTEGLWAKVTLSKDQKFDRFLVEWKTMFVCYLNPGEGRKVIRSILWEKCTTYLNKMAVSIGKPPDCSSSSHSMSAQLKWEKSTTNGRFNAQRWSLYTTKMCIQCNHDALSIGDDLAPPRQKFGVWSS